MTDFVSIWLPIIGAFCGLVVWIERRLESRFKRQSDELHQIIEAKINDLAKKIQDDRYSELKERYKEVLERAEKLK